MEQIAIQTQLQEQEARSLVSKSHSIFPWKRKAAEKELQERSAELFEPLLQLFDQEMADYRKRSATVTFSTITLIALSIVFSAVEIGMVISGIPINDSFWVTAGMLALIFPAIISASQMNFKMHKMLAKVLSKYHDIRIIGPMAEALRFDNHDQNNSFLNYSPKIVSALIDTLPEITNEADVQLSSYQIRCLNNALSFNKPILSTAILRVLPVIGNAQSLEIVRRLARNRHSKWNVGLVASAAHSCLPALEERVARLTTSQTLLRPSSVEHVGGNALLRASFQTSETVSEELLRATSGE